MTFFGPGIGRLPPRQTAAAAIDVACGGRVPDVLLHGMDFKEPGVPLLESLSAAPCLTVLELQDS